MVLCPAGFQGQRAINPELIIDLQPGIALPSARNVTLASVPVNVAVIVSMLL